MAAYLIDHAIAFGGTTGAPSDAQTTVTLNTIGATFILASYCADALHGSLDPFSDSRANSWTLIPDYPSPGDGHSLVSATATFRWVANPATSATHTFTTTNTAGTAHACLEVQAFGGMATPDFNHQLWANDATPPGALTLGPTASQYLMLGICCLGFGDVATDAPAVLGTAGWTVVDTLPVHKFAGPIHGYCGMTVAYKLFATSTTGVTNDWTWASGAYGGALLTQFTYAEPEPPSTVTYAIRRLRRFMLPWDNANREKFISRLEIILQAGIGLSTGQGSDPILMLRISKDGGLTWGNEIQIAAGRIGEYSARAFVTQLGRGRNWVFELTVSDPVDWQLLQVLADVEEGTS